MQHAMSARWGKNVALSRPTWFTAWETSTKHNFGTQAKTLSQLTQAATFKNKEKLPKDSEKVKKITAKIAEFTGIRSKTGNSC